MNTRNAPAPARLAGRTPTAFGHVIGFGGSAIKTALLSAVLVTATASIALAQQPPAPPAAPAAKPKPAPAKPKPAVQNPAVQQQQGRRLPKHSSKPKAAAIRCS